MRTSKYGESNAIMLGYNTLSWKPCQGGSSKLNLPDHMYSIYTVKRSSRNRRYKCRRYNHILVGSRFKTSCSIDKDGYMMKALVHVSKSSAISDEQALPRRKHYCQIYQMINFTSGVKVTSLENELGVTKKVLGGAVLKLVTRVKRLEGLLQQRKGRLVLSDSESEEAASKEQDIDLDALHKLDRTSLGGDSTVEVLTPSTKLPKMRMPPQLLVMMQLRKQSLPESKRSWHRKLKLKELLHLLNKVQGCQINLLGDDVNEEIMNERLGMLFIRKRRELAEQSRVKPINKTQQRDYMRDFVKIRRTLERSNLHNFKKTTFRLTPLLEAPSAKRARQEVPQDVHAAPSVAAAVSVHVASSVATDVSVPSVPTDPAVDSAHVDTEVHADEPNPNDTTTASEQVSAEHIIAASTPSSSRTRHKQLAKKRVTPIVDIADDALIKFDSASDSDDDPLPYAPYADWEMVPSLLGSIHAHYDMEGHTKHFTSLRELLHMLLGDDVNEDNMNERLGMLLMRKRRELAERSRVKPMNKTQQRDFMWDFVKNQSAFVYNQGGTMKQVKALSIAQLKNEFEYTHRTLKRSNLLNFKRTTFRPTPSLEAPFTMRAQQGIPQDVPAASSQVPAGVSTAPSTAVAVSVSTAPSIPADVSVSTALTIHADTEVGAAESRLDDTQTTSEHMSTEHTVDESITFASDSDDDPFPYAPFAGWEMVPSPLSFIHAYYDMDEHTKHFTSLRELLHMVEKNDLRKLLGVVDNFYQKEEPDTFALIFDDDPLPYAPYADWEMVPSLLGSIHAHYDMEGHTKHFTSLRELLHMVEKNDLRRLLGASLDDEDARDFWRNQDGWRIRSWRLYPRAQRMLKHGLEVPKLLVGEDLTMAELLVTQNWMVFTFHVPFWNKKWLVQRGTALELASHEKMATGKDVSNPFMTVMVCQKPLGYFSSPMIYVPRAGLVISPPGYVVPAGRVRGHSCCWVSAGKYSFCCQ
nr:hypothetical protein [Tanacetum cinerariifolium]